MNRTVLIFTILLGCQLVGEVIALSLQLPIPGPVVGMVLLFGGLVIYGRVPDSLAAVSGELLGNLSLLFVPAGVGVMLHAQRLADNWLAIVLALLLSTAITLVVTGVVMAAARRMTAARRKGAGA